VAPTTRRAKTSMLRQADRRRALETAKRFGVDLGAVEKPAAPSSRIRMNMHELGIRMIRS
jgi:hypothetical protein